MTRDALMLVALGVAVVGLFGSLVADTSSTRPPWAVSCWSWAGSACAA